MTTDSGTNMIKALRLNEWPNLQCFGPKLHNAISKYLNIICVSVGVSVREGEVMWLCEKIIFKKSYIKIFAFIITQYTYFDKMYTGYT